MSMSRIATIGALTFAALALSTGPALAADGSGEQPSIEFRNGYVDVIPLDGGLMVIAVAPGGTHLATGAVGADEFGRYVGGSVLTPTNVAYAGLWDGPEGSGYSFGIEPLLPFDDFG